ncbi:hypothetical protein [Paenibacillus sp. GXUN7292]|uniref:hypothetical protein n=1 Tax=Paenibacillus sp. GXUN7292 TaxID=3422499 RepID=UPI003D7D4AC4
MNAYTYASHTDNGKPAGHSGHSNARTWRVGSLSMGITLVLIGTALAVSLWQKIDALDLLLMSAPIVFIMLGCELLVYLKLSGKESLQIKYDWLSLMFVGIIGVASLIIAMLMSTGLMDDLKREFQMVQRTVYIEPVKASVPAEVKKIVVQSFQAIQLDKTDTNEVHLLGTVQYLSVDSLTVEAEQLFRTAVVGNTMYITIGGIDKKAGGFVRDSVFSRLTLVVPNHLEVTYQ